MTRAKEWGEREREKGEERAKWLVGWLVDSEKEKEPTKAKRKETALKIANQQQI